MNKPKTTLFIRSVPQHVKSMWKGYCDNARQTIGEGCSILIHNALLETPKPVETPRNVNKGDVWYIRNLEPDELARFEKWAACLNMPATSVLLWLIRDCLKHQKPLEKKENNLNGF